MLGRMNHKLESRLLGEISTTADMQMTLMAESKEELKNLLRKEKEKNAKASLTLNIKKNLRSWNPVQLFHGK